MKTTISLPDFRSLKPVRPFSAFLCCGFAGWCLEVIFTSVESLLAGDLRLMGRTSLLMFPIYGLGVLLGPIAGLTDRWLADLPGFPAQTRLSPAARLLRHGLLFMVLIFTAEYAAGRLFVYLGICPWDYSACPDQIDGVIRLRFAPLWFLTGLILERVAAGCASDRGSGFLHGCGRLPVHAPNRAADKKSACI